VRRCARAAAPQRAILASVVRGPSSLMSATATMVPRSRRCWPGSVMVLLVGLGLGCVECMSSGNEHGGSGAAVQRGKSFAGIPAGFARAAQSVLNQGNSSLVKTAATAAGAQLLKKTLSGLDIKYVALPRKPSPARPIASASLHRCRATACCPSHQVKLRHSIPCHAIPYKHGVYQHLDQHRHTEGDHVTGSCDFSHYFQHLDFRNAVR
jgi:hypothetical protein